MKALQNANGPDEAATSVQAVVQQFPGKEKEMNKAINSTGMASSPAPTVFDLESPIQDARRMASILSSLLEDVFSPPNKSPDYYITSTQAEDIMFAVYHTQDLILSVLKKWEELV